MSLQQANGIFCRAQVVPKFHYCNDCCVTIWGRKVGKVAESFFALKTSSLLDKSAENKINIKGLVFKTIFSREHGVLRRL
jgi:hypothetical protein